jgi:stress response protein YsnF
VPVSVERATVVREAITEENMPNAMDGPALSEEEHEVVLYAEQVVVQKEMVLGPFVVHGPEVGAPKWRWPAARAFPRPTA